VAGASDADQPGTKRQHVLRHCDADYFHQPHELNFWLPCTPAYGSNTLWLESEPGLADYRPMELGVGECLRFHGQQCDHFSRPNETEHTRVSLDFRVVPIARFVETYDGSHTRSGTARFGRGGFFAELDAAEVAEGAEGAVGAVGAEACDGGAAAAVGDEPLPQQRRERGEDECEARGRAFCESADRDVSDGA